MLKGLFNVFKKKCPECKSTNIKNMGETVEGDIIYMIFPQAFDHRAGALYTGVVAFDTGQVALFCPAAVAVHNKGYMVGQAGKFLHGFFRLLLYHNMAGLFTDS